MHFPVPHLKTWSLLFISIWSLSVNSKFTAPLVTQCQLTELQLLCVTFADRVRTRMFRFNPGTAEVQTEPWHTGAWQRAHSLMANRRPLYQANLVLFIPRLVCDSSILLWTNVVHSCHVFQAFNDPFNSVFLTLRQRRWTINDHNRPLNPSFSLTSHTKALCCFTSLHILLIEKQWICLFLITKT